MLAAGVLVGVAMLDHGMTGLFALLGLLLFVLSMPSQRNFRAVLNFVLVATGAAAVCLAWPWYSFFQAASLRPDNDYWFNPHILRSMLTLWAWPAYLCSVAALSIRRPFIRTCLLGAAASFNRGRRLRASVAHACPAAHARDDFPPHSDRRILS